MRFETILSAIVCLAIGAAGGFALGKRSAKAEIGEMKPVAIVTPAPLPTAEPTVAAAIPTPDQTVSTEMRKSLVGVDLMKILQDVRFKKYVSDGEARGVQLAKVRTGSMFERIGFQEGDVILSVDGLSIAMPKNGQTGTLPGAERLTITMLRNGKEIKRTLRLAP